ncbi:hypothetical protein QTH87_23535 [Variovorax sp. J22P168]|uniref:hypothetical protein n=1 Tax=Variovorax jilinensis TaxID=3053513 RepID=UPI0025789487|nr:hypothetical protein [Variovorax sp. J22P168]MDM0015436.1 hypothetical protein [Variovorax sp. J22P168]
MSRPTTLGLIVLTAIYLTFELAFNARLLDVVGGAASIDQVHHIEVYGRLLSGIAAALFVLQFLLRSSRSLSEGPGVIGITFWCLLTLGGVYLSLQFVVDSLVHNSTARFRRQAMNLVLVQRAMVQGRAQLDGLSHEDAQVFARPEGKAFLALFPLLSSSIERLDEKIDNAKQTLLEQQAGRELHGTRGVYESYSATMKEVRKQWTNYANGTSPQLDEEVRRQQHDAWVRYERDLARRGWKPWTVPARYRPAVANQVRRDLPIPGDWQPYDRLGFYKAVDEQVRDQARRRSDGSIRVGGQRVPGGLEYKDFVLHPAIQADLRRQLELPAGVVVAPSYESGEQFVARFYKPLVQALAAEQLQRYTAPLDSFETGGINESLGRDAARAALVPPIALLCSLLGAIGHLAKLLFLGVKALGSGSESGKVRALNRWTWLVPVVTVVSFWTVLSVMNNDVTSSRIYMYLGAQARANSTGVRALTGSIALNAMHVVAVGQAYAYPFNEGVRNRVLRGLDYGYETPQ